MAFTIGEVAKLSGIGLETVRFYERKGLIEEPPRTDSGYRQFPKDVLARIRFIRRAKELGFTLREIIELLALRVDTDMSCADVKRRTEEKITVIKEKIGVLRKILQALKVLEASCSGTGPTSECPILDTLSIEE